MQGYRKVVTPTASLQLNSEEDIITNDIIIEFDTTAADGDITFTLPSIESLFFGVTKTGTGIGGGANTFRINGTIIGAGSVILVLSGTDKICGASGKAMSGTGTAFTIWISGLRNWGLVSNKL